MMNDDQNTFKYIAIKNWHKFQSAKRNCTWIKDYVDKDFDPEINKLTVFQRGVLDMCCRLRGRHAKNLSNDPLWIVRAVSILPQERRNAISTIAQLVAKGFLVLTNQEDDSLDKIRIEENRIEESKKEEKKPSARKPRGPKISAEVLPSDSRHERIKAMVQNAYLEQNGMECPWDGSEGKQLKALLDSTPRWADTQILQCLANLYQSEGFAKGTRPREFLSKLPRYLHAPLNEFNREQMNGKPSKDAALNARNREAIIRGITGNGIGGNAVPHGPTVSPGNTRDSHRLMERNPDKPRTILGEPNS